MALEASIKAQLQQYLKMLREPIVLAESLDNSADATEMHDLLTEIVSMSDKVTLIQENDARQPSFAVKRANTHSKVSQSVGVRFAGIPLGHEFTSLILALLHTGGHPMKLDQDKIDQIAAIEGEFHFETYVSLTCHNCPDVVQALNMMAVINPNITHVMVEGGLYQDEVKAKNIMSVPTTFLNGEEFGVGRMELDEILPKIDTGASEKAAAKIDAKDPFDVLIVGGGPAGAAAAIYAARKGIRTGIVAERFGGQVMDTLAIENFISVQETEGPKLVAALEEHVKSYDVDIMALQKAVSLKKVNPEKGDSLIEVALNNGGSLLSKVVIAATGARWRKLGVPGEAEYQNKGVAYCPHCDGPLFKGKHVAVIGGGNSGVEASIDLAGIVGHVTLFQRGDILKADAVLQDKLRSLSNVTIILNAETTEILGANDKVNSLVYTDSATGESKTIALEGVFIQIGLVPNTDWLKESGVALSPYNEIETNSHGSTNVDGVFAAGDVTTIPYKQIIIAMGEGSKAALGAFDYLIRQ